MMNFVVVLTHVSFICPYNLLTKHLPGMDQYASSHVAELSPVQCPDTTPEPGNVDRDITMLLLFFFILSSALKLVCQRKK